MAKLQVTKGARQDLKDIFNYVVKQSFQNAEKLVADVEKEIQVLISYPEIGQVVKELKNPLYREIKLYKYRIIYHFENEVVSIISFHHSARLLSNNHHVKDLFE
jgi:toxin ParE1/3/4